MTIAPVHHDTALSRPPATAAPDARRVASFSAALRGETRGTKATLRQAVEGLVSSALVLPALATLRESSLAAQPFAPGPAEKRFGPLLDQHIADRITSAADFPLVEAIVDKLAQRYGLPAETAGAADGRAWRG